MSGFKAFPGSDTDDQYDLDYTPQAVRTYRDGDLERKVDKAREMLTNCVACPQDCEVDRMEGELGTCMLDDRAPVGSYFPHYGEEDVLRGWNGSGTIFFSMCNLRCVFCQNYEVSQVGEGMMKSPDEIAEMALELQAEGCHNINFVTPEHVVPQVVEAIYHAVDQGLRLPVVYNTSAYDSEWSIEIMDGLVDIYMPDFKVMDPDTSIKYLRGPDYPESARTSILKMHEQVGGVKTGEDQIARKGLILRHLIMPGQVEDSKRILDWIAESLPSDTYVNIMDQYYPAAKVEEHPEKWEELNRHVSEEEYRKVLEHARKIGLENLDPRSNQHDLDGLESF